jgi:hypothetical protein
MHTHLMSLGLSNRLTSANLRIFLAFPILLPQLGTTVVSCLLESKVAATLIRRHRSRSFATLWPPARFWLAWCLEQYLLPDALFAL